VSDDITLVEKAALSMTEAARARLARSLLAGLAPHDPETAAWYGPAAELVDAHLVTLAGSAAPPPQGVGVAGEPHDERLDDDPTLAEIKRRRHEIESGEASLLDDNLIVAELKRRLGFGK
jgi:hypothetical protein